MPLTSPVEWLLCDIEGTTTSIAFVHDVLFPHVRQNLRQHLETTWDSSETQDDVNALAEQAEEDVAAGRSGAVTIDIAAPKSDQIQQVVASVEWLMDADRKVGPLKQLQGHMWRKAYEDGVVRGHVYDDVRPAFEVLKGQHGLSIGIYSSGSVEAQRLLFGHSVSGDMCPLLSAYFDTKIGAKTEAESYRNIAVGLQQPTPQAILFVSDRPQECRAAVEAGFQAALFERPGNAPLTDTDRKEFAVYATFDQVVRDIVAVNQAADGIGSPRKQSSTNRQPCAEQEEPPAKRAGRQ